MQTYKILRAVPLIAVVAAFLFLVPTQIAHAYTVNATLHISPSSGMVDPNGTLPIDITVNTGGQGISGVDIYMDLPANLTYTSYDQSTSVLTTEATPPTVSGSTLHFARLLTTAGGYTGTSGEIIHLVFTANGTSGAAPLAINLANSTINEYTLSANILASVQNGNYTVGSAVASPTPVPTAAPVVPSSTPSGKITTLPVTGSSSVIDALLALLVLGSVSLAIRSFLRR